MYSGCVTSSREALLDATRRLLSTQGYEATSPADIRKAAGVGQGSFYHHFAGKAELASAALVALSRDMCADFDQLLAANTRPADPLASVRAYLDLPRQALAGCRIGRICMESSLDDERIRVPIGQYFAHLRTRLTAILEPLQPAVPAAALAELAVATVQGAYVTARATGDPDTMSRATSALIQLIDAHLMTHPEETS